MGPYHAIMVHFPVALWTVAAGIVLFRAVSSGALAQALDRVLVSLLVVGVLSGIVAYVLGQLVWPAETLQKTPLGRNHMLGATWTLAAWTGVLYLRWRLGVSVWSTPLGRTVMVAAALLGATLLSITGTLGGHLHGAPAYLSELLKLVGLDVYQSYYVPTWALALVLTVVVTMPSIAFIATRATAPAEPRP
jgi:hypothetical protein